MKLALVNRAVYFCNLLINVVGPPGLEPGIKVLFNQLSELINI